MSTPEILWPALRQYRHNTDNSPDYLNPALGFVNAFDYEEVVKVVTAMQEEIAALRAERATLSNGLMIQTDQVEHSEKVIEELEKVAEHAAALFYNHELTETWDALEEALRSAGYLKEDGDE